MITSDKRNIRYWCMAALLATAASGVAQPPTPAAVSPTGDVAPVHDPVIVREGKTYHLFSTGLGKGAQGFIASRISSDLKTWQEGTPPFDRIPEWAAKAIPGASNMWAPDIAYVNGRYRLYYAVSTFGSNRSVIGVATSPTLNPAAPGYGWHDEGMVVGSQAGDDFNAIDPAFLVDGQGRHWLSLGSFWTGLKLFELNPATGKLLDPGAAPRTIAARQVPAGAPSAVEAPFIFRHGGYYWLLASYDYCCKGVNSTYYTVIGRSERVEGPYRGKDGSSMQAGGGTILLRADLKEKERFRGPGHVGHLRDEDGTDILVYHAYDREKRGAPTLRIAPLRWGRDGWPSAITQ